MTHLVPVVVEFTHLGKPWLAHLFDSRQAAVHRFRVDFCRRDDTHLHTYQDSAQTIDLGGCMTQPIWVMHGITIDVHVPRPMVWSTDFESVEVEGICRCHLCDDYFNVRDHCAHLFEDPDLGVLGPGVVEDIGPQLARITALAARFPRFGDRFADALERGRVRWVLAVSLAGGDSTVLDVDGESWDDFVDDELVPAMQEDADVWRAIWWLMRLDDVPLEVVTQTVAALRLSSVAL